MRAAGTGLRQVAGSGFKPRSGIHSRACHCRGRPAGSKDLAEVLLLLSAAASGAPPFSHCTDESAAPCTGSVPSAAFGFAKLALDPRGGCRAGRLRRIQSTPALSQLPAQEPGGTESSLSSAPTRRDPGLQWEPTSLTEPWSTLGVGPMLVGAQGRPCL